MSQPIQVEINGQHHSIQSEPDISLLTVLRDRLGLTGSKYGCGEGHCGACTVLLGGVPRRSCVTAISAASGKSITTIEGLEQYGRLHPIQQAFLDVEAFQCAYCTSGMIMSSVALLKQNSNPTQGEIEQALQGNICRCGTHPRIIEAVQKAARASRDERS
jgi:aerobic-type carbon monoxide dehydrogenase small subunit (CoxS/CutS family)